MNDTQSKAAMKMVFEMGIALGAISGDKRLTLIQDGKGDVRWLIDNATRFKVPGGSIIELICREGEDPKKHFGDIYEALVAFWPVDNDLAGFESRAAGLLRDLWLVERSLGLTDAVRLAQELTTALSAKRKEGNHAAAS